VIAGFIARLMREQGWLVANHGRQAESLWQGCNATIPGVEVIVGEQLQFQCLVVCHRAKSTGEFGNFIFYQT
jgi:hypothetical protein